MSRSVVTWLAVVLYDEAMVVRPMLLSGQPLKVSFLIL
jgi:hypothetical protein